jgi:hypothetical protein
MKCQYMHAYFNDDWGRCPFSDDNVKAYRVSRRGEAGESSVGYYCDDAADQARGDGFTLELLPTGDTNG